jgi:hypothetical protein
VLDAAPTITTPVISGTAQEGQTLTAAASSESDNPVSYAWYSSADNYITPIGSGPTYLVKEGDEHFTIEVKATAANDNGVTASATSAATAAVLDAAPTITGGPRDGAGRPDDLTDAHLEKLGVLLGHRKRLLRAIAALREQAPLQRSRRADRLQQHPLPPSDCSVPIAPLACLPPPAAHQFARRLDRNGSVPREPVSPVARQAIYG